MEITETHHESDESNIDVSIEKSADICCICHQTLDKQLAEISCGHKLHTSCLLDLFVYDILCPLCRRAYTELNYEQKQTERQNNRRIIADNWVDHELIEHENRMLAMPINPEFIGEPLDDENSVLPEIMVGLFHKINYYYTKINAFTLNIINPIIDRLIKNTKINRNVKIIIPITALCSDFYLFWRVINKYDSRIYKAICFSTYIGLVTLSTNFLMATTRYLNNNKKGKLIVTEFGYLRLLPYVENNIQNNVNLQAFDDDPVHFAENNQLPPIPNNVIDHFRPNNI